MKKIKLLAFVLVGVSLLSSCSKTFFGDENNNPNGDIVLDHGHDFVSRNNYEVKVISGIVEDSEEDGLTTEEAFDTNGELTIPFDQAFPYYMENTKYDANSLLVKSDVNDIYSIYKTLNSNGVIGYKEVVKVSKDTSWYKLYLQDIASNQAINLYRSLNTKAQIFDLNYVLDSSALTTDTVTVNSSDIQRSDDTSIDNCGIDNANKNKHFKDQWYFKEIGLKETYKEMKNSGLSEGGLGTVVAVIDTGVDIKHEDLRNNIWVNSLEVPNNGIDDDNNGYIDDVNGWNFVDNNNNPDDDQGHGTHVAGIIGAENNSVGVVGIAYKTKIMPLKAGDGAGYFTQDRIASAIVYAYMNGADVINMSFGGSTCSLAVQDALEAAYTTSILVAAAGNSGLINEPTSNFNKFLPNFPAALSFVLGVMSIDIYGAESIFTNFDGSKLSLSEYELYAPGENIYSTIPNNKYTALSGTSMAAPIVSGIISLLKTKYDDVNKYPTKFFMGQVIQSNDLSPDCVHDLPHNVPYIVDAYKSLTAFPRPIVHMQDYYIFDGKDISNENNNDGTLDAGETIYFAPVLFNLWGKSSNTTINFNTKSTISGEDSKYIKIENASINYDEIGTFSSKDYLIYDDYSSVPTGVDYTKCLKITVDKDTPNDIFVNLNYNFTYRDGLDTTNTTIYETKFINLNLKVNRGTFIPKLIKEDFTLTNDKLWIVRESVQIAYGATLTVEPGTQIIFGDSDQANIYGGQINSPKIMAYGKFLAQGSFDKPIEIRHSTSQYNDVIQIQGEESVLSYCNLVGTASLDIAKAVNCNLDFNSEAKKILDNGYVFDQATDVNIREIYNCKINFTKTEGSYNIYLHFGFDLIDNSIIIFENNLNGLLMCQVQVNNITNTTIVTRGSGLIELVFKVTLGYLKVEAGYNYGGEVENGNINRVSYTWISDDLEEQRKVFDAYVNTLKILKEKNINIHCPLTEHYTENCNCSLPNNRVGIIYYNTDKVYFGDGSEMDFDDFMEIRDDGEFDWPPQGVSYLGSYSYSIDQDGNVKVFAVYPIGGGADLINGIGPDYRNVFTEQEKQIAQEFYYTFSKECVREGLGNGGSLTSENINLLSSNISTQIRIDVEENRSYEGFSFDNLFNYNTNDQDLIDYITYDGNDSLYKPTVGSTDENHTSNSELWPYITKLELFNSNGQQTETFSNEELTVVLHLNREMNTDIPLRVRFGSYGVYADYEIYGEFIDSKTWKGQYTLTTLIESGKQYFNISGGAALNNEFMEVEEAPGRFSFVLDTTKSLSKNIFGASTLEGILLSWMQDDFGLDTIMGYNVYKSDEENGYYTKINKSIISKDENEFLDTNVIPGEEYWYTFTVVLSDLTESSPAGKISVKAMDTMPPNIYHNPVYETYTGSKLTISCLISDNIGVENAYLYYRKAGDFEYKRILMNSSNDRYTASISSTELSLDGIEYYIEAFDGTNFVSRGTAEDPFFVMIRDSSSVNMVGDVDGDGEITVKDAYLILQHVYGEILLTGDQFTRADLNGDGILSTSEAYRILQYINGNVSSLEF